MNAKMHSWLLDSVRRDTGITSALATYFVVGPQDVSPLGRDLLETIRQAIAGGITFLQLRAKPAGAREILELARAINPILTALPESGRPLFVIDDRVDVAAAAQHEGLAVDGVHVGQSDLPVGYVAEILEPGSVIGLSAATPETVAAPDAVQSDYLGIGAYHDTTSKADAGAGVGAQKFAQLVAVAAKPAVAIGGVGPADALDVARAGGAGLCVISDIARADDVTAAAQRLAGAWRDAVAAVSAGRDA